MEYKNTHGLKGNLEKANDFWHQGIQTARSLGARFEEGLICFEMGKRLDDIDSLKRAGRIFQSINAKAELSRVDAQIALVGKGLHPIDHGKKPSGEFEHGNDNAGNGQGQAK
ncbi:MAG: hypothetical protein ABR534_04375 [Desulfotignum sp.]|nr:hypothetical protein [Desulfobacteraceae bacterium]